MNTSLSLTIRDATRDDFQQILSINRQFESMTSILEESTLEILDRFADYHRVAEVDATVVAFLVALREGSVYNSPNYCWFCEMYDKFLYIDRVVVDSTLQRAGVGRRLYQELFKYARDTNIAVIACEISLNPSNVGSETFHSEMGFKEIGRHEWNAGHKRVSFQVKTLELE